MINIPLQNKKWSQSNNSDLLGNISVTKNISFDDVGYLKLSNSPRCIMNSTVDADFATPVALVYNNTNNNYTLQTKDDPFTASKELLKTYPTQLTAANFPVGSTFSDIVNLGQNKYAFSEGTTGAVNVVYSADGTTFLDTDVELLYSLPHKFVNIPNIPALGITDGNQMRTYELPFSVTPTLIETLILPVQYYRITSACYFNRNIYISTINILGGNAMFYIWDGLTSSAQNVFEVKAEVIFDTCVWNDTIVILTSGGELLQFTGGGFRQLATFPIFDKIQKLVKSNYSSSTPGMNKNILTTTDGVIYINFNNSLNTTKKQTDMPDGIWCYDPKVGLYHKYSHSNALIDIKTVTAANINVTTNIITLPDTPITGTEVIYSDAAGSLTPLVTDTKYFVIKVSGTEIKLATTKANALAGTAIDLLVITGDTTKLVFFPNTDFGTTLSGETTFITTINNDGLPIYGEDVVYSGEINTRTNTSGSGIGGLMTTTSGVESRGYFITPKITSQNITDTFNKIILKYSPFKTELDKIIIKYRTIDDMRNYIDIVNGGKWEATWTSTNTFTTTQTDLADAVAGDEIEFLAGAGAGILAHIVTISDPVAGVYTVTIDETFDYYASGDKATFIFRNWKKFDTIVYGDNNAINGYFSKQLGISGKFLQLKIELRGIETRVEELLIDNVYHLPAK